MFFIIDEAQVAGEACMGAFSSNDGKTKYAVLHPIIQHFRNEACHNVILSGTSFSLELFKTVTHSAAIAKTPSPGWEVVCSTGNFFEPDLQFSYIARYLPPTYLNSESGKYLKTCIWRWLWGRCVATEVLASQLNCFLQALVHSPLSGRCTDRSLEGNWPAPPHELLDAYVKKLADYLLMIVMRLPCVKKRILLVSRLCHIPCHTVDCAPPGGLVPCYILYHLIRPCANHCIQREASRTCRTCHDRGGEGLSRDTPKGRRLSVGQ